MYRQRPPREIFSRPSAPCAAHVMDVPWQQKLTFGAGVFSCKGPHPVGIHAQTIAAKHYSWELGSTYKTNAAPLPGWCSSTFHSCCVAGWRNPRRLCCRVAVAALISMTAKTTNQVDAVYFSPLWIVFQAIFLHTTSNLPVFWVRDIRHSHGDRRVRIEKCTVKPALNNIMIKIQQSNENTELLNFKRKY